MPSTLRIYCELIPAARLVDDDYVRFFAVFGSALRRSGYVGSLELVVKCLLPDSGGEVDEGVLRMLSLRGRLPVDRVWLWGQLRDRRAVFLNRATVDSVFDGWHELLALLARRDRSCDGAMFDLEPDRVVLERLHRLNELGWWEALALAPRRQRGDRDSAGHMRRRLEALVTAWPGLPVLAACVPLTALGDRLGPWAADGVLGTPLVWGDASIWPEWSAMVYTSFVLPWFGSLPEGVRNRWVGWIGGVLARRHCRVARRWGARASVIAGTTAIGIFGDEPSFSGPEAMRPLIRQVVGARPDALGVFNLTGLALGPVGSGDGPDPHLGRAWATMLAEEISRVCS